MIKTLKKKKTIINNKTATQKDTEITAIAYKISQLLNNGHSLSDIPFEMTQHMFRLLLYIFQKNVRNQNDITIIRHYLTTFPNFIKTLNLRKSFSDPQEVLHKIALFVQCEHFSPDSIVFLNGEIGDKFYLIFRGTVSILVPTEYECFLSEDEYIAFLNKLLEHHECDLVYRTIESNKSTFFSTKEINDVIKQCDILSLAYAPKAHEEISIDEYIERIVLNCPRKPERNKVILWKYHEITQLSTGKSFGEIALGNETNKRTATVIAVKDSYIGTIRKDIYQTCIRDVLERIRKNNIESILSHKIFHGYNPDFFEHYYFNYFKFVTLTRSEELFRQGETRNEIFFIKNGEIEISMHSRMKDIDEMIRAFGGEVDAKEVKKMLERNSKINKFYHLKRIFPIYIIKDKEILGMDDYALNDIYIANAKCVSQTAEIFSIEKEFFMKMITEEKIIKINYDNCIQIRKQVMKERIQNLKDISLKQYYNIVSEYDTDNWTSRNSQKTHSFMLNRTNTSNVSNMRNTMVLFTKTKRELESPEKVNTEIQNKNDSSKTKFKIFSPVLISSHRYALTDCSNNSKGILPRLNYPLSERSYRAKPVIKLKSFIKYEKVNKLLRKRLALYNSVIDKLIEKKEDIEKAKEPKKNKLNEINCMAFDNFLEKKEELRKIRNKHNRLLSGNYNSSSYNMSTLSNSKLKIKNK